jgi:hypothetical protein
VDAVREVAQVLESVLRWSWVVRTSSERDERAHERLLDAVVEVALERPRHGARPTAIARPVSSKLGLDGGWALDVEDRPAVTLRRPPVAGAAVAMVAVWRSGGGRRRLGSSGPA